MQCLFLILSKKTQISLTCIHLTNYLKTTASSSFPPQLKSKSKIFRHNTETKTQRPDLLITRPAGCIPIKKSSFRNHKIIHHLLLLLHAAQHSESRTSCPFFFLGNLKIKCPICHMVPWTNDPRNLRLFFLGGGWYDNC